MQLFIVFLIFEVDEHRGFIVGKGRDVSIEIAHAVIRDSILSAPP